MCPFHMVIVFSANGTLGGWGAQWSSGRLVGSTALCHKETWYQDRECTPPMNGGIPCKELIEGNMPRRIEYYPGHRCNRESYYIKFNFGSNPIDKS